MLHVLLTEGQSRGGVISYTERRPPRQVISVQRTRHLLSLHQEKKLPPLSVGRLLRIHSTPRLIIGDTTKECH